MHALRINPTLCTCAGKFLALSLTSRKSSVACSLKARIFDHLETNLCHHS